MVRPLNDIGEDRRLERGRAREGVKPPLVRGVRSPPRIFFEFNMSVEAILMHFETIFAYEIRPVGLDSEKRIFSEKMRKERKKGEKRR